MNPDDRFFQFRPDVATEDEGQRENIDGAQQQTRSDDADCVFQQVNIEQLSDFPAESHGEIIAGLEALHHGRQA